MRTIQLTKTEDQVVRLKLQGFQRKEIAYKMNRSLDTVSVHFKNIYEKTDVQNEIELYNWYVENVFKLNIRKMLQVAFLLVIMLPSIIDHNDDVQRASRYRTSARVSRTVRSSRRGDSDSEYFLFN